MWIKGKIRFLRSCLICLRGWERTEIVVKDEQRKDNSQRLKELKNLRDEGLLSEKEYNEKHEQIINNL